jgi:hypothetical protein
MNIHDARVRKLAAEHARAFMRKHKLALDDLIEIGAEDLQSPDSGKSERIRTLAEHAWTLSHSDMVRAVEILREWTGLSFDAAFEAIEEVRPPECADLVDQPNSEPL